MNGRVLIALFLIAVFSLGLIVVAAPRENDDDGIATAGTRFEGAVMPKGLKAPDFSLENQDGERISMRDFRGQPVIVTFLYTTCEDTCPVTATTIRGALDDLGRDVPALAVSVDPANDTPARARRFLSERRMTGRMRFLLGDRVALSGVWDAYGIRPQGEDFEHSARVVLVDRAGRQRVSFPVSQLTSEGLVHDIRRLEAEATAPTRRAATGRGS